MKGTFVRAQGGLTAGVAALLIGAGVPGTSVAADAPVVVELFTSQGCSSCPPADAYLGELATRQNVIPLAYHVDYWNYIGWDDPYASKQMTLRQKDYARTLNQRYVYTPEMVVNGANHEVGSDRHGVDHLIEAAQAAPQAGPSISLTLGDDGKVRLHLGAGGAHSGSAVVWLVKFDREHQTPVQRGENAGETLTEFQTVRTLHRIGMWTGAPLDIAYNAREADEPGDGGCAILVQRDGAGPIIAAAMVKFPPAS